MKGKPAATPEDRIGILERDSDRHEHTIEALALDLNEVRAEAERGVAAATQALKLIPQMAGSPSTSGHGEDAPEPALVWLTVDDPALAQETLGELEGWLSAIYVRYPEGSLADCWRRHPVVVEELLVLRDAHETAWSGSGSPAMRLDWLARHRPDGAKRINSILEKCGITNHAYANFTDYQMPRLVGQDDAAAVARWWADTHGKDPDPAPGPGVLAEARARQKAETYSQYQQH